MVTRTIETKQGTFELDCELLGNCPIVYAISRPYGNRYLTLSEIPQEALDEIKMFYAVELYDAEKLNFDLGLITPQAKNAYIHDEHLGKLVRHQHFWYKDECYSLNTDKITTRQWYTKRTNKGWVEVPETIDLELAFETRNSRRYM